MTRDLPGNKLNYTHTCVCGKHAYPTKQAAKRFRSRYHPGNRMDTYRCDNDPTVWHLGHLRGLGG